MTDPATVPEKKTFKNLTDAERREYFKEANRRSRAKNRPVEEWTQQQIHELAMEQLREREQDLLWEFQDDRIIDDAGTRFEIKDDAQVMNQLEEFLGTLEQDRPFEQVRQCLSTHTLGRLILKHYGIPAIGKDWPEFVSHLTLERPEINETLRRMHMEQRLPNYTEELAELERQWLTARGRNAA